MNSHTFKKEERLTSKKILEELFISGKSFSSPPFRLVWLETKTTSLFPVQLAISVPKKLFANAVDRNILKRRIREAYRKNKHLLYEAMRKKNHLIALMIIYAAKEDLPYSEIEKKMVISLQKLIEQKQ